MYNQFGKVFFEILSFRQKLNLHFIIYDIKIFSQKKMKYSILTGSFGYDGINEFLRELSYGKGRTNSVRGAKMPTINKVRTK